MNDKGHKLPELAEAKRLFLSRRYRSAETMAGEILQSQGQCHEVWFLLSQIKAGRGLPRERVKCLEKALEISPDKGEYLAFLAQAWLDLGRLEIAEKYASKALLNLGHSAQELQLLSQVFHAVGRYEKSTRALKRSIELDSGDADRYYSLGVSQALCGHITDARKSYRKAIHLDPAHVKAWPALSKISRATKEQNHVDKLAELAEKTRSPWLAINIYHGLAKELDDLGRYAEAFSALEKGKKRLLAVCPHDPFDGVRKAHELAEFYAGIDAGKTENRGYSDSAPIFVVGMPRTGTTVVERILTNHPDVTTVGERPQFGLLLKTQCKKPGSGIIDAGALKEAWPKLDFEGLGHGYEESVRCLAGNAKYFVDKLPLNIVYAGAIMTALPNAKVICLVRDACDTVVGNFRQVFEYATGMYAWTLDLKALAMFTVEFRELVKSLQRQFPSRFHVVHYEQLVSNPQKHSQAMFNICGLEWSGSFVDIHKNPLPVGTASTSQVQEPIHTRFTGRSMNYEFCLEDVKRIFSEHDVDWGKN